MTDVQLLTLAIAVIVPLSLLIYSNSRITEAKETLRAEIRAEFARFELHMDSRFNQVHEEIRLLTGKMIEIDNRLSRIEDRIGPAR
ncbi:MAG TPA: hypothetical protein VH640_22830 [Bryobacteraceae bacterium]|jgi:hypothetical protein